MNCFFRNELDLRKNFLANKQHIEWLCEGVDSWNERRKHQDFEPDFEEIVIPDEIQDLSYGDSFEGINLENANFRNAFLVDINLEKANLKNARFQGAGLFGVNLSEAILIRANFTDAMLYDAKLNGIDADEADFTEATICEIDLQGAKLAHAKLEGVNITNTQPLKSVLYDELLNTRKSSPDLPQKIENIEELMKIYQGFKKNYGNDTVESYLKEYRFYFRGEYDENWELSPSVMRSNTFRENEDKMLLDLMSQRPQDFMGVTSSLSQLVLAQHYGLKTRLLDITRNPLVALFHSCKNISSTPENYDDTDGILHIFIVPKDLVKRFDSDAISVVTNLTKLPRNEQDLLMGEQVESEKFLQKYPTLVYPGYYPHVMGRLYHYIKQEKPYFKERVDIRDMFRVFIVEPKQSFERIRAQSGAFLISAFHERFEQDKILDKNKNIPIYEHYKIGVPAGSKRNILKELRFLNITREVLLPGLIEAANAIVEQYEDFKDE